ncbi:Helix-turn-helix domain-containing protein [Klenkia marina]|uniref:Helix-turn-helix domain-containing protein n=1 Tax=Klenkia marina TaxID=1960309 RepID=A0A1G4YYZ0_9ACTN|nr:helix-turn-helix domain-containing protein [Klenkia marina]SCX58676.1 Helix-turn-helix domain-containing protein [Klenkia marina]
MTTEELAARLAELEARVAALEGAPAPGGAGDAGTVTYGGQVRLHGEVAWEIGYDADAVLGLPPAAGVRVLAALGHAVRLEVVRHLLRGPASVAELVEAVGGSSSGQLYHHLTTLTGAGVVEADGGGRYRVPATGVVPVLVLLLASADLGGVLR